jgi:hypothetical protein
MTLLCDFAAYKLIRLALDCVLLQRNCREVQHRRSWKAAHATALACGALAASAAMQWCCDTAWNAPGAGPKQPLLGVLADYLHELSMFVAAGCVTWLPAIDLALLGPLMPAWVTGLAAAGYKLAYCAGAQEELVSTLQRLFAQRPSCLQAFRTMLLQDNRLHELLDFSA